MITPSISNLCEPTAGANAESFASKKPNARIFDLGPTKRFVGFKYVEGHTKLRTAYVLGTTSESGAVEYIVSTSDDPNKPKLFKVSAADVCGSTDEFIRLPDNDNGTPANLPKLIELNCQSIRKRTAICWTPKIYKVRTAIIYQAKLSL